MLTLIAKDFKLLFASTKDKKRRILSYIFTALVFAGIVALETFIFYMILNNIKQFNNAAPAFMAMFLFIIAVLMTIFGVASAKKLFFNKLDMEQLRTHPVSNAQVVASKMIFLFLIHYVSELIFTYPLFVSYGILITKPLFYYYLALFYPIFTFFIEIGVALVFVYPFKLLTDFLKNHIIVQFVASILFFFGFTFVYSRVLDVFIQLVANNQLSTIFNADFVNGLLVAERYFIPTNFLSQILLENNTRNIMPLILISFGVFILGFVVSIISLRNYKNSKLQKEKDIENIEPKIKSIKRALIEKELRILFKDSSYLFSFTGLLIVQPFMAYLVISSINVVFRSGTFSYYLSLLPNFIPLIDILLVMLFSVIINQGANNYISMEDANIKLMKTIPVNLFTQLFIKVSIPLGCSIVSLFATILVLLFTGVVSIMTAVSGFILTVLLLFICSIISLLEELKIKRNSPRNSFLSNLYSYLLPIVYFISSVILSYFTVSIYLVYLIGLGLIVLLSFPYFINFKKKVANLFLELEMVN